MVPKRPKKRKDNGQRIPAVTTIRKYRIVRPTDSPKTALRGAFRPLLTKSTNSKPPATLSNCAHKRFDAIWKEGIMTRGQTYEWMQHKFSLTKQQAHIGYFSDYMCEELMRACDEVLRNNMAKGA